MPANNKSIVKLHRLIVRNLSFETTENDIKSVFEPIGKILEVVVPMSAPVDGAPPKCKGFAFIQYRHKAHALKAIKELNGKKILKRTIAVDLTLSKKSYESQKVNEAEIVQANDSASEAEAPAAKKPRLTKQKPVKKREPLEDTTDRTVFVKNLLFEVREDELNACFEAYGSIRYIKLVKDEQGRSRGSAFVCFSDKEDMKRMFEDYALAQNSIATSGLDVNSLAGRSMLTELAPKWVLHGRWMECFPCKPKQIPVIDETI